MFPPDPIIFFETLGSGDSLLGVYKAGKFFFVTIDLGLLAAFIYVFKKSLKYRPKLHPKYVPEHRHLTIRNAHYIDRWNKIIQKAHLDLPASAKIAIMEADALINDFLSSAGLEGEHLADRLEQLSPEFKTIDRIRRAHRVRNQLVRAPHLEISELDAQEALEDYEEFLKEAGVL